MSARTPLQNRVAPDSRIISVPARGRLMGNRGCLHDEQQRIVRSHNGHRWIYCALNFKDRKRILMTPGKYTELFFLDEATALAAGHRPCKECQYARYMEFRKHWIHAFGQMTAVEMDRRLHSDRLDPRRAKLTFSARLMELPEGVVVALGDRFFLWSGQVLRLWSPEGYGPPEIPTKDLDVQVLTPRSTVAVIRSGFSVSSALT